ncbi:unnamed protein product [Brachionus calyciflorus]|uniref:Zinc finger C2H2 LYAR-type domain-containing protein n=1 Tax=Brachionus calyciflorus TaxID=104777 RepID=A0A814E6C5_9BILA|nr:unnamed protein product [Brachionus calyciflorus]
MVYFNCSQCGTGLRKNQVETHMNQCRSRTFSCIDCQKDFKNDEYKSHVKCLTESERYESKNFVAKQNKGDVKQNAWFEKVLKAVESFRGSPKAKSLLEKLQDYPNVPRKKAKFFNFVRNSFRSYNVSDSQLEEIWGVIESFDKADKPQNGQNNSNQTNGNNNNLKRKLEENENDENESISQQKKQLNKNLTESSENKNTQENVEPDSKEFDWQQFILNEFPALFFNFIANEISIYKKYKKFKSDEVDDSADDLEKFKKKLNKKLKKMAYIFSIIDQDSKTIVKIA